MAWIPDNDDVIAFNPKNVNGHTVFKIHQIKRNFLNSLSSGNGSYFPYSQAFAGGFNCEIMTTNNSGWRKAKIRLVFQIELDEQREN